MDRVAEAARALVITAPRRSARRVDVEDARRTARSARAVGVIDGLVREVAALRAALAASNAAAVALAAVVRAEGGAKRRRTDDETTERRTRARR
jgi:molybdenum cofactor biosynthesis enzyme